MVVVMEAIEVFTEQLKVAMVGLAVEPVEILEQLEQVILLLLHLLKVVMVVFLQMTGAAVAVDHLK
jgi:hypothetical protein